MMNTLSTSHPRMAVWKLKTWKRQRLDDWKFARGCSRARAHKSTLHVPIYCAGQVRGGRRCLIIVCGAPRPTAWRINNYFIVSDYCYTNMHTYTNMYKQTNTQSLLLSLFTSWTRTTTTCLVFVNRFSFLLSRWQWLTVEIDEPLTLVFFFALHLQVSRVSPDNVMLAI